MILEWNKSCIELIYRLGVENKFLENKSGRIFAFDKFTLQNLANKSGCVQTNLLHFLYITSEVKEYYEALFLSYRPQAIGRQFHNFSRQMHSFNIQDHRSMRGLLAKPFKKFPKAAIRPAGSNFWQAPNLQRNFKRVTLQHSKEFIVFFFSFLVLF